MARLVERVKKYTLVSGDITTLTTCLTNIDYIRINRPTDYKYYNLSVVDSSGAMFIKGFGGINRFITTSNYDDAQWEYNCSDRINPAFTALFIPKGTYADLATAQADLAGTVIQYELATPITTQLSLDELYAFENGTLYNNSFGQFDYVTAQNKSALINRLNETVEKIDEDYVNDYFEVYEPTLLNSWINGTSGRAVKYYKDGLGFVHIEGMITSGVDNTICFILPDGFKPIATRSFAVRIYVGGSTAGIVEVLGDGSVRASVSGTSGTNLDGISFRAEET